MKPSSAQLKFNNYYIKEISFIAYDDFIFPDKKGIPITIDFRDKLIFFDSKGDKATATIELQVDLFKGKNKRPFLLHLVIVGNFESNIISKKQFEKEWLGNSLAMLFPYVRETISYITKISKFPHLLLPTINIVKTLKQKKQPLKKINRKKRLY